MVRSLQTMLMYVGGFALFLVVVVAIARWLNTRIMLARDEAWEDTFGFRRRCGWCGVQLRGWQLNLCAMCRRPASSIDVAGAPCREGSRWQNEPDTLRPRWWDVRKR